MERRQWVTAGGIIILGLSIVFGPTMVTTVTPDCLIGSGHPEWELEVWVHEETMLEDGDVELEVEVLTSGQTGATIRDVSIDFEDANGSVYRSVGIGAISGLGNETRTVRLEQPPERIRLETGAIEKGNDDAEYWIKGVQRTNGEYEQFVQEHREC